YSGQTYNSIDNIAEFFASRGKKFSVPKLPVEEVKGKRGFRPGQKVRHPKYGEGTVYQREGDGEDAKITVQFPSYGLKKLVKKYARRQSVRCAKRKRPKSRWGSALCPAARPSAK